MDILVIQNSELGSVGVLGDHLQTLGAHLHTWTPLSDPALPSGQYAGLIVLGGPMNVYEDDTFPHLRQTVELIRQFHAEDKPIMGICLGAQLIARAFGCRVYPNHTPELGFSPLRAVPAAASTATEPWLRELPEDLHLMQWHFDTFDLPHQAEWLITNDSCQYQAYRIGSNIYGFQFHLEVTPEIVMGWLALKTTWIDAHYPHLEQTLRQQLEHYADRSAQFAEKVAHAWLNLIPVPAHR